MDIKLQPRPANGEESMEVALEKLFTEDWGGPKSALALAYLRETVIPDLANCLRINWHLLDNTSFLEILISKLNTQFAYPATFAEGLAQDITVLAKKVMGTSPLAHNHPWQPWEIIIRMFTIGYRLPEIIQKTGYPEAYIDMFRKRYLKIQGLIDDPNTVTEEQLLHNREIAAEGISLIRFVLDFTKRFSVFDHYSERLQAEQIIMELEYNLESDILIRLFEGLFEVDRQVSLTRYVEILKGSKTAWLTCESYFAKTKGYGILKDWTKKQINALLVSLRESNLILEDNSNQQGLTLSERTARIIAPLVVPNLAGEIESVLHIKARDRIARITALLQGIHPEIAVYVIRELVKKKETGVIICFKALQRRVSKKVFMQIIWACGQMGGKEAISILSKTILDRDSAVRIRTCQAIGQLKNPSFYFSLINALDDPVAMVRENAALALGELKMPSALKYMERIIENPIEEPQVQRAAKHTRAVLLKEKSTKDT